MRHLFLTVSFYFIFIFSKAQNDDSIINEFKAINKAVTNKQCGNGNGMVISNRAMNIFLADKTGYLSESGDLSLYTNYVTLNTSAGTLTINHNFQKAKGIDEPIKKLFSFGVKANIADGFNATFLDKKFRNELGLTLNQTWIGKVRTKFSGCIQGDELPNQKQAMNALRTAMLHSIALEINKKKTDFEIAVNSIDSAEVQNQNIGETKELARRNFYETLKEEYEEKFARLQAEILTKTNNFKLIATHWTSLVAYVPIGFTKYNVTSSLTSSFEKKHPYPFDVTLSHTKLWESSKTGRLFVTLSGRILSNNSITIFALDKTNFAEYKNLGRTDTIKLASLKNDEAYIGAYKTFLTPSLRTRAVYFPFDSHVGISFLLEKNFGSYNLLNARLGVPIILINSKRLPAVNFEFQIGFFDITHKIKADKKVGNTAVISVGVGIPFSRLIY